MDIIRFIKIQNLYKLLLLSMISGDGHNNKKGHVLYYTTSKEMANQLQGFLVMFGYNQQLYGPYSNEGKLDMYQIHISKEKNRNTSLINKRKANSKGHKLGWDISPVINKRIVCFSVSNSIVITRNKNKVSIQGNCKNMMHCYRIASMGIEIAKGEGLKVFREDREFLLKIRNGELTYDEIKELNEKLLKESDEAFDNCDLIDRPDHLKAKENLAKIRKQFYKIDK